MAKLFLYQYLKGFQNQLMYLFGFKELVYAPLAPIIVFLTNTKAGHIEAISLKTRKTSDSILNIIVASDRYLVTTHFQPTSARSAFPCWDEPQYKARFKIGAVRQRNYVALSNMPLDNTEDVSIFWGSGLVIVSLLISCRIRLRPRT